MKTENDQWVVCSNVDAPNGGYISLSEEGLLLMDLSYCFYCKKKKKKRKKKSNQIFIKLYMDYDKIETITTLSE